MIKIYCFFDILFSFGGIWWKYIRNTTDDTQHTRNTCISSIFAYRNIVETRTTLCECTCRMSIWWSTANQMDNDKNITAAQSTIIYDTVRFGELLSELFYLFFSLRNNNNNYYQKNRTRLNGWKNLIDLSELVKSLDTNRSIWIETKVKCVTQFIHSIHSHKLLRKTMHNFFFVFVFICICFFCPPAFPTICNYLHFHKISRI